MTLVKGHAVGATISNADMQAWSNYRIACCPYPHKLAFRTDIEAAHAMVAIWRWVADRWQMPRRVYLCTVRDGRGCGLWHMTSQERRTPTP